MAIICFTCDRVLQTMAVCQIQPIAYFCIAHNTLWFLQHKNGVYRTFFNRTLAIDLMKGNTNSESQLGNLSLSKTILRTIN